MKKRETSNFYPILINLKRFPCLVIGGGEVALRKVQTLLLYNAKITVLSPKICTTLKKLISLNNIKIIRKPYSREYIKNFKVIFSATNNRKVNEQVHSDCSKENKLLNVVDVPDLCDFILPAVVKRGDLSISVSSQGSAPFYAKEIKNKLNHIFPDYYEDIINLAGYYRKLVMNSNKIKSFKQKDKAFKQFFLFDWKKILASEGKKKANEYVNNIFKEL
jgi:precorrin-2 dehydrogenase/sirohydrochlorin ferrochelatase